MLLREGEGRLLISQPPLAGPWPAETNHPQKLTSIRQVFTAPAIQTHLRHIWNASGCEWALAFGSTDLTALCAFDRWFILGMPRQLQRFPTLRHLHRRVTRFGTRSVCCERHRMVRHPCFLQASTTGLKDMPMTSHGFVGLSMGLLGSRGSERSATRQDWA